MVVTTQRQAPSARGTSARPAAAPAPAHGAGRSPSPDDAAAAVAALFPVVYRRYHSARSLAAGGGEQPITRRGLEVLVHLATGGPLTIGEQASHLGLRRNSTSELVSRLEAKGLVARIRDERDERRVLVWLTDAGREVVARVGQVLAPDLLAQVMASLAPDDRATVVRGFELLARAELPVATTFAEAPASVDVGPPASPPTPRVPPEGARS
jgi:DNA-binding MarR family transcriptional regulator